MKNKVGQHCSCWGGSDTDYCCVGGDGDTAEGDGDGGGDDDDGDDGDVDNDNDYDNDDNDDDDGIPGTGHHRESAGVSAQRHYLQVTIIIIMLIM